MTQLLTEAEAAAELKISARFLRKFRQSGKLDYFRFGNAIRYSREDLRAFAESARQCSSIKETTAPIGGPVLQSNLVDFESAQKKHQKQKRA